jgi:integrase
MSLKHQKRWVGLYNNYLQKNIGSLPLKDISDAIVLELIESIYKTKPQTALKVKNLISVSFNFAIEKKWYRGINPTKMLQGNSLIKKPKNNRMKYLEEVRVGELLEKMSNSGKDFPNTLIYILMVTGLRVGSLIKARWSWLNGDILTIPKLYMKNREEFKCPLPTQAIKMLDELKRKYNCDNNKYIFQSVTMNNSCISDNTVRQYMHQLLGDKYTLHGFRTLFNRVVTKSQKFNIEMIESQLTHAFTQTQIRRIYLGEENFLDERKKIVQYMADWIDQQNRALKLNAI